MNKLILNRLYRAFLKATSVSIDTRAIDSGDIFFGLKGPNFDGNQYADAAIENGASAVVVDDPNLDGVISENEKYIMVDDTLLALQLLASHHRDQCSAKIIGITGSNGKTTTKELLAKTLSTTYKTIYTQGNLNNHIGVPLTLLNIKSDTEIAIVEMGANHLGEIADLCRIAKPDFGLITNIGKAHIEGFGSLEGVKKGKGELYAYIRSTSGHLFVNESDETLVDLAQDWNSVTFYSLNKSFNNIPIHFYTIDGCLAFAFESEDQTHKEKMQLYGDYNIPNILAALNVAYHFDISPIVASAALAEYVPQNSRSQKIKTDANDIYLDAYNANPTSMEHALYAFAKLDGDNKIVVLGDMFELGDESLEMHQSIADLAHRLFDKVILVGKHFSGIKSKDRKFSTTKDLSTYLEDQPILDHSILIKGSRGMALELLVDRL